MNVAHGRDLTVCRLVGPIVFLASDAFSLIIGLVLPVDGGAAAMCPTEWKPE